MTKAFRHNDFLVFKLFISCKGAVITISLVTFHKYKISNILGNVSQCIFHTKLLTVHIPIERTVYHPQNLSQIIVSVTFKHSHYTLRMQHFEEWKIMH